MPVDRAGNAASPGLPWAAPTLEIDDSAERATGRVLDEQIRVLARENRLAVVRDIVARHPLADGVVAIEVPLRCVAQAHPDCRFRWVRITVDLGGTEGVSICDLSPRDEVSEQPVKVTTTYHGGLSFSIAAVALSPEVSADRTTEHDVYFPTVTSSGIGLAAALWDFTAVADSALHVDRVLRLLVAAPAAASQIPVRLTLRASVTARGFAGRIPLIGRQNVKIPLDDQI